MDFFEILDLSTPNIREKYLLKAKRLDFFSLQATAVARCGFYCIGLLVSMQLCNIGCVVQDNAKDNYFMFQN